jgi:hypothetical protein
VFWGFSFLSDGRVRLVCVLVCVFVVFWVPVFSVFVSVSASSSRDVAASSISEAEQSVSLAYGAVLDAEKAGANVSGLADRLNDAAELLSQAHVAFEAGNFTEAARCAGLSTQVGGGVWDDANRLQVETQDANGDRATWFTIASLFAVVVVAAVSFFSYRYFKRWYYRRLLKMKPRVGRV